MVPKGVAQEAVAERGDNQRITIAKTTLCHSGEQPEHSCLTNDAFGRLAIRIAVIVEIDDISAV
jgi:hypothetical protein